MNSIVPSVIVIRNTGRTVGDFPDFSSTLGAPASASLGSTSNIYASAVAPVAKSSGGFSLSGLLGGLTDLAGKVAPTLLNLQAQKAQLSSQTQIAKAQSDAQIAALRGPVASTPVFFGSAAPASGGMSTGTKLALGGAALAVVLFGGLALARRR